MKLTLSQSIEGVTLAKTAAGFSQATLDIHTNGWRILQGFIDPGTHIDEITKHDLVAFFAWLNDGYLTASGDRLGQYSLYNIHSALCALWKWAYEEEFTPANIMLAIPRPKLVEPVIEPFSKGDVEALLQACRLSRSTATRDRAILLTLLSTGLRATELCGIQIKDVSLRQNSVKVLGKGKRERIARFGKRTAKAIWLHIQTIESKTEDTFLFASSDDPLTRYGLHRLLCRLGKRAKIKDCNPHRFRHTFAINYLRNGGDLFTLQALMGHSSLEMVRRYARVAAIDCAAAHERADPVDNWRL
ncbi:MAG: tyrosine-type recombinase/integrase [Thermoflexales bacterium]|nr:tyrosine-type recombinase/integrase [Thermoflexales bacterium]